MSSRIYQLGVNNFVSTFCLHFSFSPKVLGKRQNIANYDYIFTFRDNAVMATKSEANCQQILHIQFNFCTKSIENLRTIWLLGNFLFRFLFTHQTNGTMISNNFAMFLLWIEFSIMHLGKSYFYKNIREFSIFYLDLKFSRPWPQNQPWSLKISLTVLLDSTT